MQRKVLSGEKISRLCEPPTHQVLSSSFLELGDGGFDEGRRGLIASAVAPPVQESMVEGLDHLTPLSHDRGLIVRPFRPENLDLTSLDLTVGAEIYECPVIYPDISIERLRDLARGGDAKKHGLNQGEEFIFYPEVQGKCKIYYVVSEEEVTIPESFGVFIDSKSTLGRLGCICHGATSPNQLRGGSKIVAAVRPYFFPIKARAGKSQLFQAAFTVDGDSHMSREQLLESKKFEVYIDRQKKDIAEVAQEDKLKLTYSTRRFYVSKSISKAQLREIEPIDVDARGLDWGPYFELQEGNGEIITKPRRLYLFGTREELRFRGVCGRIERAPGGELSGSWGQFAGIIQAGFDGRITMEYMTRERRAISNGSLAGCVEVDEISGDVNLRMAQRSYCNQDAPALAKVFAA